MNGMFGTEGDWPNESRFQRSEVLLAAKLRALLPLCGTGMSDAFGVRVGRSEALGVRVGGSEAFGVRVGGSEALGVRVGRSEALGVSKR